MSENISGTGDIKFLNNNGNNFYKTEKNATVNVTAGSTISDTNNVIDEKTNKPRIEMDKKCPKESFKIICDLIRKQLVTYDEAWSLLLDIMPKEKEYVKEYIPPQPFNVPDITYPLYNPPTIWCGSSSSISSVNSHTCEISNSSTSVDKDKEFLTPTK